MRRPTDIDSRAAAIDRLTRVGRAALPDASSIAERHLGAMSVAVVDERDGELRRAHRTVGTSGVPRRRVFAIAAVASFVAVPSLALAGVLPDPVQRVASKVAGAVGVDVPLPAAERAPARDDAGARQGGTDRDERGASATTPGDDADGAARGDDAGANGDDRGHVNGETPGQPEPGEERGNRFGQVPEGPDQGKAAEAGGGKPDSSGGGQGHAPPAAATPAPGSGRPATPAPGGPKPDAGTPATPAPGTGRPTTQPSRPSTPEPAAPAPAQPGPARPTTPAGGGAANGGGNGSSTAGGAATGNGGNAASR